jgi:hypothetical protein
MLGDARAAGVEAGLLEPPRAIHCFLTRISTEQFFHCYCNEDCSRRDENVVQLSNQRNGIGTRHRPLVSAFRHPWTGRFARSQAPHIFSIGTLALCNHF